MLIEQQQHQQLKRFCVCVCIFVEAGFITSLDDVENSTDVLVPVFDDVEWRDARLRADIAGAINAEIDSYSFDDDPPPPPPPYITLKQRILPEVHNSCAKPKSHMNGTSSHTIAAPFNDNLIQFEERKLDIPSGSNQTNGITNGMSSGRRNRDASGAKFSPIFTDLPNGSLNRPLDRSISPQAVNGKFGHSFGTNGSNGCNGNGANRTAPIDRTMTTAMTTITTTTTATSIPTMTSCADGLAPALSEQNLRLLQIVHEHKVGV